MKRYYLFLFAALGALVLACGSGSEPEIEPGTGTGDGSGGGSAAADKPKVGQTLPDWSEGYLDIHAVNTGRGECSLLILPDGTTMLVDTGCSTIADDDKIPPPPMKPNASSEPTETVINYLSHFVKAASGKLDYLLISHWHADHMGGAPTDQTPMHPQGQFRLCGAPKIASTLGVDKVVDRGFTFPRDNAAASATVANYKKFVEWSRSAHATQHEEFRVGAADQFVLRHDAAKYPTFAVRNLVCNGVVWTGVGTQTKNTFPSASEVAAVGGYENICSNAFHLKYGAFDYFSGGDLSYSGRSTHSWFDIEAPVAAVVPQVEVMKAHHHGTSNCNSSEMLKKLKPQTIMVHVWRDVQPNPATIARMFSANSGCNIFTTNLTENNKGVLGSSVVSKFKSTGGHIVVRVSPGGQRYYVYVLDDTNENYKVKQIFGPYTCN